MLIRAVLFDVDDTLVDYSGAERAGILRYLADLGVAGDALDAGARFWHAAMERHFARYLDGELDYTGHRRERARDMIRWLGRPAPPDPSALSDPAVLSDPAALDAWFDGYRQRYENVLAPFDDVLPCLDAAARVVGARVGVVTNNNTAYQRQKLARTGLLDRFACVVGTDLAGARKPDPAIFLAGCEALGAAPAETAYVGDHLDLDARAATAAGLVGVWLHRSGPPSPDCDVARITSLGDLPGMLT